MSIGLPHARDMAHKPHLYIGPEKAALAGVALILLATLFNALLAVINAHVFALTGAHVAMAQAGIVGLALIVVMLARPEGFAPWLVWGWAAVMLWLMLCIARDQLDFKIAGDIVLIPIFACLGLSGSRGTLFRALIAIQVALVVFAIWELFFPTSFGSFFAVRDYYVNTRGFSAGSFWAGDDNLFLSSQRPAGRIIDLGLDINRAGSLFLEPVTLGNWTVIICAALVAFWRDMSLCIRTVLIITNILLLIACDGRLAMGFCLLLPLSLLIFQYFSRSWRSWLPVLYLPAIFLLLASARMIGILDAEGSYDNLAGRFANGFQFIISLDLQELLALKPVGLAAGADSGWVHIVLTQSIFGLGAFWIALTLLGGNGSRSQRLIHCLAVYMAIALPISYSVISIKSAAVMWFLIGLCKALDRDDEALRSKGKTLANPASGFSQSDGGRGPTARRVGFST